MPLRIVNGRMSRRIVFTILPFEVDDGYPIFEIKKGTEHSGYVFRAEGRWGFLPDKKTVYGRQAMSYIANLLRKF